MVVKSSRHPVVIATFWMMGVLLSFIGMAIGGRELSQNMGTFEILLFRSLIGLIIISVILCLKGWNLIGSKQWKSHLIRNVTHFGGQYGWFYGIALIPLAEVFALEFTIPIWTAILSAILLGERLSRPRLAAIGLGFLGILIILRPGLAIIHPAAIAVLLAAVGYSISHVYTRKLAQIESPFSIIFYMTVIQLPLGLFGAIGNWVTPTMQMAPWLLVVGVTALSAHYCLSHAMKHADATVVVPMDYLRLPLIAIIGFSFYSEEINWFVMLGAMVMLCGNYISIRAEKLKV
jgi:drug/metabolite transporter (DMT)-like permease